MAKTDSSGLPPIAKKRLQPYIERGITNGVFTDASPVVNLWNNKVKDSGLKETIEQLGGMGSEVAQQFLTDVVLTDLTAILRQKAITAHVEVWECNHRTVGVGGTNPRQVCFIFGQTVVDDGESELEPALFRMGLWDDDASIADNVEADGNYKISISCKQLNSDVLDLRPLGGLTQFTDEEYEHGNRAELLLETFDSTPIAELEDDVSRGFNDYRLVKGTVSFAGVQNSKAGNQFGKMLLNCMTSVDIAQRFGKYSQVVALVTTKINGEYGLSANMETCVGTVVVAPPQPEAQTGGDDDDDDDAADYFSDDDDIPLISNSDDDDDDATEEVAESVTEEVAEPVTESITEELAEEDDEEDDGEADFNALPVVMLKQLCKAAGIKPIPKTKAELVAALEGGSDDDDDDEGIVITPPAEEVAEEAATADKGSEDSDSDDSDDEWDDWD